jgi:hypothetical protein
LQRIRAQSQGATQKHSKKNRKQGAETEKSQSKKREIRAAEKRMSLKKMATEKRTQDYLIS